MGETIVIGSDEPDFSERRRQAFFGFWWCVRILIAGIIYLTILPSEWAMESKGCLTLPGGVAVFGGVVFGFLYLLSGLHDLSGIRQSEARFKVAAKQRKSGPQTSNRNPYGIVNGNSSHTEIRDGEEVSVMVEYIDGVEVNRYEYDDFYSNPVPLSKRKK